MNERPAMRVDKWLWYARFFKTRSLAGKFVSGGHLRLNSLRVAKPSRTLRPGDVLTFPRSRRIRVIRVLALPTRRGPAAEAYALYEDLTEDIPEPRENVPSAPAYKGKGRPTGKDRRKMALLRGTVLE